MGKLHIEDRGRGAPVVFLHGAPTTPAYLRPLAERLSRGFRTLLVHLPGYGDRPALRPYRMDQAHTRVEESLIE